MLVLASTAAAEDPQPSTASELAPAGDAPPAPAPPEPLALPRTRLVFAVGALAPVCPDADALRAGVIARLGADPFAEPAERVLMVAVEGEVDAAGAATARRARVELFDAELLPLGERVITSDEGCAELLAAAALAASIAIAPERALAAPTTTPPPTPEPPPVPPPQPPDVDTTEPPDDDEPRSWDFLPEGATLLGGASSSWIFFLAPGAELGPGATMAARWGELELRGELFARGGWSSEIVSAHGTLAATVLPCLHVPLFELTNDAPVGLHACASATTALVVAAGGYLGLSPYLGAGGRLGLEWVQHDLAALRFWGQVEGAIFRPIYVDLTGGSLLDLAAPANAAIGVTFEIPVSP
ncbi:MAG: hypothetical protein IT383_14425 [Deltaproteobacteria bacterium]|nr:hypothetical protein [Deltaproteobacteria bacterium]